MEPKHHAKVMPLLAFKDWNSKLPSVSDSYPEEKIKQILSGHAVNNKDLLLI